jgi:excisionase family DNA binding protein
VTHDRLYSLREVATLTDTSISTVRRWVEDKRIPVERVGPLVLKRLRVRHSVLVRLFPHLENLGSLNQS